MTLALDPTPDDSGPRKSRAGYKHLNDAQRRAIITALAAGQKVHHLALKYGVNPATIWRLKQSFIQSTPDSGLDVDWRTKLHNVLPSKSVDAIERSLDDKDDPHRAANTGLTVMKGLGYLQGEGINVQINTLIQAAPADLINEYVSTPLPLGDEPESDSE